MKKTQKTIELAAEYILPTYQRLPVAFAKDRGVYLWDLEGKKYLDMLAGVAVDNLGHAHPKIVMALSDQAKKLTHTSNIFQNDLQTLLAQKLVNLSEMNKAFFCNSGAEAIEACIKLARHYAFAKGFNNKFGIITMHQSFHGRTFGAISATGQPKYQKGFGPLLPGFTHIPYDNLDALRNSINSETLAVMVEPIQGEGGVNIPHKDYLKSIGKICEENGLLLIIDEVQTGIGRTGKFLASTRSSVKPDLIALAKGLGSGFPIGACLVSERIAREVKPGIHASTFGGNQLACRVALEVVKIISTKAFLKKVIDNGIFFLNELDKLQKKYSLIQSIRGSGLMLGCELSIPIGGEIVRKALDRGLIINSLHDSVLRFVPPLIINRTEIRAGMSILDSVLKEVSGL